MRNTGLPHAVAAATMALVLSSCGGEGDVGDAVAVVSSLMAPTPAPPAPAPTVSVSLSSAEIAAGGSARLTWSSSNAASCTGSGAWTGGQAGSGTSTVSGLEAGRYTWKLSCTGDGGTASAEATLTVAGAAAPAQGGLPYGLYVGNPNGNDAGAMGWFQGQWDASVRQLRRPPQFFGTFTDFSRDWDTWPDNAGWTAWSFTRSERVAGMKPVIGIKLSTNAYWNRQADAFREIVAGKHDQVYRDVVTKWRDAGYGELRFRISYEFNGNFMPDNFGNTPEMLDLWKQAFAHVADLMHAVPGVKVLVVWNPANINWTGNSVADAYPGDRYVDVIASDVYSPTYSQTLKNWGGTGNAAGKAEWAAVPANRIHFWDYPGATEWTLTGSGWGMVQALDFALARRKPFGVSETGVGGDNKDTGPADDPHFPAWLRSRLDGFRAKGGTVDHVIVWDFDASDGSWRFTGVPAKAATAAAWTAAVNP